VNRRSEKLALLVGSNPLPNFLAAMALEPKEVVLLYTPETEKPKDYLSGVLSAKRIRVTPRCIQDATDARCIQDVCNGLDFDHLHYSGGTKPMAAHARMAFNRGEANVSYLDERRGLLRFEDGYDETLSNRDLSLTLEVLLELHGVERLRDDRVLQQEPADSDSEIIAKKVLRCDQKERRELLCQLNRLEEKVAKAKQPPFDGSGLGLSQPSIPANDWTQRTYKHWRAFLRGGWLERWTALVIDQCLPSAVHEISTNIRGKRDSVEFEVDAAVVHRNRLYVVSCTTEDQKKELCKSKLFEVAMRSRQMGGDLARCALVCLLDGCDSRGPYVDQLRSDIQSLWDAPNVPRVFGLADLREWSGINGTSNLGTLTQWLLE